MNGFAIHLRWLALTGLCCTVALPAAGQDSNLPREPLSNFALPRETPLFDAPRQSDSEAERVPAPQVGRRREFKLPIVTLPLANGPYARWWRERVGARRPILGRGLWQRGGSGPDSPVAGNPTGFEGAPPAAGDKPLLLGGNLFLRSKSALDRWRLAGQRAESGDTTAHRARRFGPTPADDVDQPIEIDLGNPQDAAAGDDPQFALPAINPPQPRIAPSQPRIDPPQPRIAPPQQNDEPELDIRIEIPE